MKEKQLEALLLLEEIGDLQSEEEFELWLDDKSQKWEESIETAISNMDLVEIDRVEVGLFDLE